MQNDSTPAILALAEQDPIASKTCNVSKRCVMRGQQMSETVEYGWIFEGRAVFSCEAGWWDGFVIHKKVGLPATPQAGDLP